MTPELAEVFRTMDAAELGRRIRLARIAAGLTQADLAASDVSPAYVSRIETGARRPESGLLQRMAQRMSVTVEELLTGLSADQQLKMDTLLDQAEVLVALDDPEVAEELAAMVLEQMSEQMNARTRRRARYVHAAALHAVGATSRALREVEQLVTAGSRDVLWMKTLLLQATCHYRLGDFAAARVVAERGLHAAHAAGLDGLEESTAFALLAAAAQHDIGDTLQARRTYELALRAIDAADTPTARLGAYLEASRQAVSRQEHEEARGFSQKALAIVEAAQAARTRAWLRVHLAGLHLAADDPDVRAASTLLNQSLAEWPQALPHRHDPALLQLAMARLRLEVHDFNGATDLLHGVADDVADEPLLLAEHALLTGRIAAASGERRAAFGAYERAAAALLASPPRSITAQKWYELGAGFESVKDTNAALDAFRRAGSLTGLHRRQQVLGRGDLDNQPAG